MRLARVQTEDGPRYALIESGEARLVRGLLDHSPTGETLPLDAVELLAPVEPRSILGMAHNTGAAHRLLAPQAFLKPVSTLIGPGQPIPLPQGIGLVEAEAELALVIGRRSRHLSLDTALDAVLGYTAANDVTARDWQATDSLWLAAKGLDGFTPVGPWITLGAPPENGSAVALFGTDASGSTASTDGLARGYAELLVFLSAILTLEPGDLVLTGAPGAGLPLGAGDRVTVSVEGVGELSNPVTAAPAPTGLLAPYAQTAA